MKARRNSAGKKLYGPTVQYADGTVVAGKLLDIEDILTAFERLNADARSAFLCVFAHDLTVAVRALLFDRPVPEADLDRVWKINEFMHQLTSCANPRGQWSARDGALLLRSIIDTSFERGVDRWIGHALAVAAGNTIQTEMPFSAK
ncbi:MAG TPA: hypothetical protein VGM07_01275 [Stellaceae bacterium]|jgi:hypothetical protein